jgi:hypothetical protein
MLADEDQTVSGLMNKVQVLFADILPDTLVAQLHRLQAQPLDNSDASPPAREEEESSLAHFIARPS